MSISKEQRDFVETIVRETLDFFNCDVSYSIQWNNRFRKRVADALYTPSKNHGRLRFSTFFWGFMNDSDRKSTIIHEVCHIVDSQHRYLTLKQGYRILGGPHGEPWKKLMRKCGENPSRAWKPDLETYKKIFTTSNKYCIEVKCSCKIHMITKNRATRIKNGSNYTCNKCKTRVRFV